MRENLVPIVIFAYKRPELFKQALESLSKCDLAQDSKLFIFCDGPKENSTPAELENISKVRKIAHQNWSFKSITVFESKVNKGLANSVIEGVTRILDTYNQVIVLESDLIFSKGFLCYMNRALEIYKDEASVFGISGYKFPMSKEVSQNTFFLPIMSSWGWATWKNKWERIEFNLDILEAKLKKDPINHKFNFNGYNYWSMFNKQKVSQVDSWAIRFYVSMFLQRGLFLYPKKNLVQHMDSGLDATHVKTTADYKLNGLEAEYIDELKKIPIQFNENIKKYIIYPSSRFRRIIYFLKNCMKNKN